MPLLWMLLRRCFSIVMLLLLVQAPAAWGIPLSVVVDPGHHPDAPGARGCSGTLEYRLNRALAEVLVAKLRFAGHHVSKTPAIPFLRPRQRAVSAADADLLLSLHHDSVQPEDGTYTPRGFCTTKARGFSLFVRDDAMSRGLAIRLAHELRSQGIPFNSYHGKLHPQEGYRLLAPQGVYDGSRLAILQTAAVPAILMEAAVIANPEDEVQAQTVGYQERIADAVVRSLAGCRRRVAPERGLVCVESVPE